MSRFTSRSRVLTSLFLACGVFVACGGHVAGEGTGGGPAGGGGGTRGGGGTGGAGGSGGSGCGANCPNYCVDVSPSSFGQSCTTLQDCTVVATGILCDGECGCPSTPINLASLPQYETDTESLQLSACPCPFEGTLSCVNGTCTVCGPGGGPCAVDAGPPPPPPPPDAGTCVDLTQSMFDSSCNEDSDCIEVSLGHLCSRGCLCGGSAINQSAEAEWQQDILPISIDGPVCGCPFLGSPRCIDNECISCGGDGQSPPGCPDAGF
jgi:hypothetical protein